MTQLSLFPVEPKAPTSSKPFTVAIDFDGTLVEHRYPEFPTALDILPGARERLKEYKQAGFKTVLYTCRNSKLYQDWEEQHNKLVAFIAANDLAIDEVSLFGKPIANVYIDDRAARFYPGFGWAGWGSAHLEVTELRCRYSSVPHGYHEVSEKQTLASRHPLSQRFHEVMDEFKALHDKKQADYGTDTNPFANVCASSDFNVEPWVGAVLRANDKMRRIQSFVKRGQLENESIEDALKDAAVYFGIAYVLYELEGKENG